jgi:hypothetical protein
VKLCSLSFSGTPFHLGHALVIGDLCVTKVMASFGGTTQKCMACDKTVYLVDKLTADGRIYHKACFRCHHCRNTLKVYNMCAEKKYLDM